MPSKGYSGVSLSSEPPTHRIRSGRALTPSILQRRVLDRRAAIAGQGQVVAGPVPLAMKELTSWLQAMAMGLGSPRAPYGWAIWAQVMPASCVASKWTPVLPSSPTNPVSASVK
jgi:hypothetical protein